MNIVMQISRLDESKHPLASVIKYLDFHVSRFFFQLEFKAASKVDLGRNCSFYQQPPCAFQNCSIILIVPPAKAEPYEPWGQGGGRSPPYIGRPVAPIPTRGYIKPPQIRADRLPLFQQGGRLSPPPPLPTALERDLWLVTLR